MIVVLVAVIVVLDDDFVCANNKAIDNGNTCWRQQHYESVQHLSELNVKNVVIVCCVVY